MTSETVLEPELEPEFRYSVIDTIKNQIPEPVVDTDYFKEDKFDCIVAFEIHVSGYENEDECDIESRAYEAIKNGGDLECLGVMMKERDGSVRLDLDGKPFNKEAWIKQKSDEMKIIRKEKTLTGFT